MKEWFRKKVVFIKHNPQVFPKLLLIITCCFYAFNLNTYSHAAHDISSTHPAIFVFVVTLLSFLMIISFVPVKASLTDKKVAVLVTLGICALEIALQIIFVVIMLDEISAYTSQEIMERFSAWPKSVAITIVHLCMLALVVASIVAMPLYYKLLQKINTARASDLEEEADLGFAADILEGEEEDIVKTAQDENEADMTELNKLDG